MSLARISRSAQVAVARSVWRPFSTQTTRFGEKSALDAEHGSVGSKFQKGEAAQAAQKVGGPFDKDGAVGKEFTKDGKVGATAQEAADKPIFDKDGVVGKQFKADGALGQIGEKVGGPFSKDGAIGKQFNADGSIGGTVQENLGGKK